MPEVIIVGVTNTDRTRDLTPTAGTIAGHRPPMTFPTSGGGARFLSFLETELVPFIEKRYATRNLRILAGHSFGGLFALYARHQRPELFHGVIAASPTFAWDNGLLERLPPPSPRGPRLVERALDGSSFVG